MKRTDEQKQAFVQKCLEIEKAGGDVLGYIEVNWPSYTPRATWYNLQKQFLCRRQWQLTEGKPKVKIKRKEVEEMRKERQSQRQTAQELIARVKVNGDAWKALTEMGFTNPPSAMRNVKSWAKNKDQEIYAALTTISLHNPEKQPRAVNPAPAKEKPVENPIIDRKAVETVFFGGKTYEKMEKAEQNAPKTEQNTGDHVSAEDYRQMAGKIRDPKKNPVTCCAPSTRKGVEVPDELPVCAVKSRIKGEWHLSGVEGCVHLIWEDLVTHQERSLGLPADAWQKLAEEIPVMLIQLGLSN